jgi:hypothetical protein
LTVLPKFWSTCLIITGSGGSEIIVTDNRRRRTGTFRTRGGTRIPDNCMVAIRKFIAAVSPALRTVPDT